MKQKSKFFLVYSIALFSVALILILFSQFTGMKTQTERDNLSSNVLALTDKNEELTKEKNEKETQILLLEQENEDLKNQLQTAQNTLAKTKEQTEKLMQVQVLLNEKKESEARTLFDTFTEEDLSVLGEYGTHLYEYIRTKVLR